MFKIVVEKLTDTGDRFYKNETVYQQLMEDINLLAIINAVNNAVPPSIQLYDPRTHEVIDGKLVLKK